MFTKELLREAEALLALCRSKKMMIATAESCTGGLLAALLTDIAGSSDMFERGYVTYSYPSKTQLLGVGEDMLATHGAVSQQVAMLMAEGAKTRAKVDAAVAITGIAGPGGGTLEKPVGTVCFAIAIGGTVRAETCLFKGNRSEVRMQSVMQALSMLKEAISSSSTAFA